MSEIYPSVRLAIRDSVTRILFDRPGKWLTTAELLNHCEEAETSDTLAKILSDMAKTGRLMRGLKTLNAQGREVNTWGLSPKLRDKIMAGQLLAQSQDASHDAPAPAWQIDAPQTTLASITQPGASLGTEPQPLPPESYEDEAARLPASVAAPEPAPVLDKAILAADPQIAVPLSTWHLAEPDKPIETPQPSQAVTDIYLDPLPECWLPELRLRLLGDGEGMPELILHVHTEGGGAFWTMRTRGPVTFDPGEAAFLPTLGDALCQFINHISPPTPAASPYGIKHGAK